MSEHELGRETNVLTWHEKAVCAWETAIGEVAAVLDQESDPARAAAQIQACVEPHNPPPEEWDGTAQRLEVVAEGDELVFREAGVNDDEVRVQRRKGRWMTDELEDTDYDHEHLAWYALSIVWFFNEKDLGEVAAAWERRETPEPA